MTVSREEATWGMDLDDVLDLTLAAPWEPRETSVQHGDLAEFSFFYGKTKAFLACTVYK